MRLDQMGLGLLLASAAWVGVTGLPRAAGATAAMLLLHLAVGVAFALGRRTARTAVGRTALPLGLAGGAVFTVLVVPGALSGEAAAPPLGYGNANGALLLLAAGAAMMAAASTDRPVLRRRCLLLAVLAAGSCALTRSLAATAMCVLVVLAGVLLSTGRARRSFAVLAVAVPVAATSLTVAAVAVSDTDRRAVADAVTASQPVRFQLWAEAADLARAAPVAGVGPGGFAARAPSALEDDDLRWAHSLLLQHAAEVGSVGALLLLAVLTWSAARLARAAPRNHGAGPAGVLLGALLAQAAIDYTAHFPLVTTTTAALVGVATAGRLPGAGSADAG